MPKGLAGDKNGCSGHRVCFKSWYQAHLHGMSCLLPVAPTEHYFLDLALVCQKGRAWLWGHQASLTVHGEDNTPTSRGAVGCRTLPS